MLGQRRPRTFRAIHGGDVRESGRQRILAVLQIAHGFRGENVCRKRCAMSDQGISGRKEYAASCASSAALSWALLKAGIGLALARRNTGTALRFGAARALSSRIKGSGRSSVVRIETCSHKNAFSSKGLRTGWWA